MKRRDFFRLGGLTIAGLGFRSAFGMVDTPMKKALSSALKSDAGDPNNFIVIVELGGGNDDLEMLLPYSYFSELQTHRSSIMSPENDYLTLNGYPQYRLHPKMPEIQTYFNQGYVGFLPGTASISLSRSHGTATKRVLSGINSVSDSRYDTGVLGRVIDDGDIVDNPNYPTVVVIGGSPAQSAQGINLNHSFTHKLNSSSGGSVYTGSCPSATTIADENIQHIKNIAQQVDTFGQLIEDTINQGFSMSSLYGTDNFSKAMQAIAKMKSGQNPIPTQIFVVRLGGFDTHGNQFDRHHTLMRRLSQGIGGFIEDAIASQFIENVRGGTVSEFGRQIAANSSMGTDHGDACTQMVFGACMNNQIPGQGVVVPETISSSQGIAPVNDIRDFWSMKIQWISGVDNVTLESYFENDYTLYIPNFGSCGLAGLFDNNEVHNYPVRVFPNPVIQNEAWVRAYYLQGDTVFELHTVSGELVHRSRWDCPQAGKSDVKLDFSSISSGNYILSVIFSNGRRMVKRVQVLSSKNE